MTKALTVEQKQDRKDKKLAYELASQAFDAAAITIPEWAEWIERGQFGPHEKMNAEFQIAQRKVRALPEFVAFKDAQQAHWRLDDWAGEDRAEYFAA